MNKLGFKKQTNLITITYVINMHNSVSLTAQLPVYICKLYYQLIHVWMRDLTLCSNSLCT
jgi:hypothetical protein